MTERRAARLEGEREADVLVLGGGASASVAALELARRGRDVVLLEEASVAADIAGADLGGIPTGLALPYSEAVARWGRAEAGAIWQAHRESHERLRELLAWLGRDCGYRRNGGFLLASERAEGSALADSEDLLREDGFPGEFLDHYMFEARFDVRGFAAAYWAADDGALDPRAFARALASAVREVVGVYDTGPILTLDFSSHGVLAVTDRGSVKAPCALLALDAAAFHLLPGLAERTVALVARRLVCRVPDGPSLPALARILGGGWAWRAIEREVHAVRLSSRGTPDRVPRSGDDAYGDLTAYLAARLPGPLGRVGRWSGPTAVAPDGLPLVGLLPGRPAALIAGLAGMGHAYTLAAARWAAEALVSGADPTPKRFRAARAWND